MSAMLAHTMLHLAIHGTKVNPTHTQPSSCATCCWSTGDEYEVEKILAHRDQAGVRKYKVRWLGYDYSHDTWEPESNLSGCKHKVQDYLGEPRGVAGCSARGEVWASGVLAGRGQAARKRCRIS